MWDLKTEILINNFNIFRKHDEAKGGNYELKNWTLNLKNNVSVSSETISQSISSSQVREKCLFTLFKQRFRNTAEKKIRHDTVIMLPRFLTLDSVLTLQKNADCNTLNNQVLYVESSDYWIKICFFD